MDGSAIKELERINLDRMQIERDGMLYSGQSLHPVYFEPRPDAIKLHTLSGIIDYIKENVDEIDFSKMILSVDSPFKLTLMSAIRGVDLKRDVVATVVVDPELKTYEFGNYQQVEFFIVSLRSMFEASPDTEKLITYVSSIRGGKTFELDDDGASQTVTTQAGVHGGLTKKETAPVIVKLRPYRTFRDIDQINSEFLFRMKLINTEDNIVGCCLYEADGGRWRNFAVRAIRDYLAENLPEKGPAIIA